MHIGDLLGPEQSNVLTLYTFIQPLTLYPTNIFGTLLASKDALEVIGVTLQIETLLMSPWWVRIPTGDSRQDTQEDDADDADGVDDEDDDDDEDEDCVDDEDDDDDEDEDGPRVS